MNFIQERESSLKLMIQRLMRIIGDLLEIIKSKDAELQAKYRLVDWIEKEGKWYCKVHLVMTNSVNDFLPEDIARDDDFISGFDMRDARTIINLANYEHYKPKASIVAINHEEGTVRIRKNNKLSEPLYPKDLQDNLDTFSQSDVFNLGRMAGENDVRID
jgi:hypothetical protein